MEFDGILISPIFLVLILLSTLILFFFRWNNNKSKNPWGLLPGPSGLPIIGNLHQLGKHPHISLYSLAKRYGSIFYLRLGEIPTVILSTPEMAKEAMKIHDVALATRPPLFAAKYLFYDCTDVAFAPYGAHWRHVRKICILELFSAKRVQSYGFVREEEAAKLVERIAESHPGITNLSKCLNQYANGVLCRIVFGKDFNGGGEYDRLGFQEMLNEYQELLGGFSIGDFFPSMEFVHRITGLKSRLLHAFERFDKFFDDVIDEKMKKRLLSSSWSSKEHKDFVDILLEVQQDEGAELPLTMDNVKAILLDMFAAGTDTTFITLDWAMIELITNPKKLEKAQSEVRSVVGKKKYVSESDLPNLHYLKAVIKEVYRLHPPAPVLLPRESMEDIAIGEYKIPEKTRVFINAWAVGRDPKSWTNPAVFEPERFLNSDIDFKGQDFELIPFGAGRRSCPAITFGSASVEIGLAQMLQSFDWELPPGIRASDLDMTEVFGITMHRKDAMMALAKPYSPPAI
ncbi:cytochrome P450 71AP13-like [Andrographis paniculata]|uniref:cytochrome P450 71AP13-like n=1 Tax=Andrographis paniculata TaxID=175694 RepID=UPI0021E6FEF4|nr:cytochrome P450 71AP13-like [Andrographis paniculata]